MNDYLTYCARSKLLYLLHSTGALAARLTSRHQGSLGIELLYELDPLDITITQTPRVCTDFATLKLLKTASINYDYMDNEFVFSQV